MRYRIKWQVKVPNGNSGYGDWFEDRTKVQALVEQYNRGQSFGSLIHLPCPDLQYEVEESTEREELVTALKQVKIH